MNRIVKLFVLAVLSIISVIQLPGQTSSPGRRLALVIGNSGYQAGPLANPVNDAEDVAASLEQLGFEVQLNTNRTLSQMEDDLVNFKDRLSPGDIALFFYAGHGVQIDGDNYLLPVDNGGISDQGVLKRRAIPSTEYINALADAQTQLNIIILDACRDNPLPQSSRGGNRGLTVIQAPRDSETVVVFATKAGDVAADGSGRNSTFTRALLEELPKPDVDLLSLFNAVGSKVRESTSERQIPTIYSEPLSQPFYFASTEGIAEAARQASDEAAAQVAALEAEIAAYQQRIEQAANERERNNLELEEQRQQALLAAQRIEANNLAREAQRREEEAAEAQEIARLQRLEASAAQEQQRELETLAAARRQELEQLASDAQSQDPNILLSTIHRLETVLSEIGEEYQRAMASSMGAVARSFAPKISALTDSEPEIWESDDEFEARLAQERAALNAEIQQEQAARRQELDVQQARETQAIRQQLGETEEAMGRRQWLLRGSDVVVASGDYDRNERLWTFVVGSNVPWVPLINFSLVKDYSSSSDLRSDLTAMQDAVEAQALTGEILWGIERQDGGSGFGVVVYEVRVKNLVDGQLVVSNQPDMQVSLLEPGQELALATSILGSVQLTIPSGLPKGTLMIDGQPWGAVAGGDQFDLVTTVGAHSMYLDFGGVGTEELEIEVLSNSRTRTTLGMYNTLGFERTVDLTAISPIFDDRSAVEYQLTNLRWADLEFNLASDDFDAYLYVTNTFGETFQDNNGGEENSSRVVIANAAPGTYTVHASAAERRGRGTGALTVVQTPIPEPVLLMNNIPVNGRLEEDSRPFEGKKSIHYLIENPTWSDIVIDLESDDFDAYLYMP